MRPRRTRAQREAEDKEIEEEIKDDVLSYSSAPPYSITKRRLFNAGIAALRFIEDEEEKQEEVAPVNTGSELHELHELFSELSISLPKKSATA